MSLILGVELIITLYHCLNMVLVNLTLLISSTGVTCP